uniref:lysozyme n=1 Tax=Mierspenaeopsis hardwickii TaxID=2715607 RepID=G9JKY9_9EUCA|nr:chicken-type lysozyme [Mierspenaeopsis hardwickii]
MRTFPFLVLVVFVVASEAKVFRKCELASLLENRFRLSRDEIKNWVCIAEYESSFNTATINDKNRNKSTDYGIFQINNKYWCDNNYGKNVCGIACSELLSDDITTSLRCAQTVRRDTEKFSGYKAWVAYNRKCKNRNLDQYMAECWYTRPNIFP